MDEVTREMRSYRDDHAAFDEVGVDYSDPSSWTAEEWERIDQINHAVNEEWTYPPPDGLPEFPWWVDDIPDGERIPF